MNHYKVQQDLKTSDPPCHITSRINKLKVVGNKRFNRRPPVVHKRKQASLALPMSIKFFKIFYTSFALRIEHQEHFNQTEKPVQISN